MVFGKEGLDQAIDEGSNEGGSRNMENEGVLCRRGCFDEWWKTKGGSLDKLGLGPSAYFQAIQSYMSSSLGLPLKTTSFTGEQPPTHSPRERCT